MDVYGAVNATRNYSWSTLGPGAGPIGPCGSLPTRGILCFCELCGGLFTSFWLTFYLQLTKEQISILLQVCESCIGHMFLNFLGL